MKNTILLIFLSIILIGCKSSTAETEQIDNTVEMDTIFCKYLMPDLGGGVTGADGAISIDLKDGRSMFMWGDSFFGDVVDGVRQEPISFLMGNVFTTIDGSNKIKNYYKGTAKAPESKGDIPTWYWPGDGVVKNETLYLFMSQFHKEGEGSFGFAYDQCDYFAIDTKTMEVLSKNNFPAANINGVHYGHAVLEDGDYVYIYGTLSDNASFKADVHVARCKVDAEKKSLIEINYWDGSSWQTDAAKTQKIAGITQEVSEQFNVFQLDNKIVLVTQDRYKNPKDIYSFTSDKPEGPFGNEKLIFTVDEPHFERDSMMTYNTMVHPQYKKDNKILMCYNVNTFDLAKVWIDPNLYQPRFFWMPISKMLD